MRLKISTLFAITFLLIAGAIYINFHQGKTTPAPQPSATVTAEENKTFLLSIAAIKIENVPIIPDVNGADEAAYLKALEGGVAHFKNTAKPGQGSNTVIFGHSSYYWYKTGDYKSIFAKLPKLKKGDLVEITYKNKKFSYEVSETKIVPPEATYLLNKTSTEQVTLMTCYPIGTTKERYVVIAKLKP